MDPYFKEMHEILQIITGLANEPNVSMTKMYAINLCDAKQKMARAFLYMDFYDAMIFDSESAVYKVLFHDPQTLKAGEQEKTLIITATNCSFLHKCCIIKSHYVFYLSSIEHKFARLDSDTKKSIMQIEKTDLHEKVFEQKMTYLMYTV